MEKYRSTADSSTGIHPFLPIQRSFSFPRFGIRPILFLIRFPLFLILSTIYLTLSIISFLLTPIPILSYFFSRFIDYLLLRPILLCFGIWFYEHPQVQKPRVRVTTKTQPKTPTRGDLIVANHASPLDLLYLRAAYSPQFLILDPTNADKVIPVTFWSMLSRVGCVPSSLKTSKPVALQSLSQNKSSPLVLFPENSTSNGKGVLAFPYITTLLSQNPSINLFALGISYSNDKRETFTIGSRTSLFFRLLTEPANSIKSRITAIPTDIDNVQATIAHLASVPALRIGSDVAPQFVEHWKQTNTSRK